MRRPVVLNTLQWHTSTQENNFFTHLGVNKRCHTNYVFEASCKAVEFIVRIAGAKGKIGDYVKEQWAVERASEKNIPVAEILEVGHEVIPVPYMMQYKIAN